MAIPSVYSIWVYNGVNDHQYGSGEDAFQVDDVDFEDDRDYSDDEDYKNYWWRFWWLIEKLRQRYSYDDDDDTDEYDECKE